MKLRVPYCGTVWLCKLLVLTITDGEDTVLWNCMAMYRYWYRLVLKVRIPYCGTVWLCTDIGIDWY